MEPIIDLQGCKKNKNKAPNASQKVHLLSLSILERNHRPSSALGDRGHGRGTE